MFFLFVFTIWAAVLTHIFYRTKVLVGLRWQFLAVFGIALYFSGFAYVPARVMIAKNIAEEVAPALSYTAAWFIGFAGILWTLLFIFEIVAAAVWLVTRRRVKKASVQVRRTMAAVLWSAAGVLSLIGCMMASSTPSVTRLEVTVPGAEVKRFVLISDSHLGAISSEKQWCRTLKAARELRPDAVLIPGDLVDDHSRYTEPQVALIREFFPRMPVYITTGNHEFYSGVDQFKKLCERLDFRLLRQEVETLSPGLSVAGVDDRHFIPAHTAVEEIRPKIKGAVLFLTHRPEVAHLLGNRPMTLVLAGHTHGGQSLPMVFLVGLGNGGFKAGYYKVGEVHLYVSRGTGVWGPPMRLLSSPELVLIEVRPGAEFKVGCGSM
jgi:predicted MPP superfamily phosphohydrolase